MTLHAHQDEEKAHPMKAKKDGKCAECRTEIYIGDKMVWDPEEKKAYCEECGEALLS